MADKIKLVIAGLLLIGGLAGFYYFEEHSLFLRVVGLLLVIGACIGIAVTTGLGRSAVAFFQESQLEMRKVVWPTNKETTQTTMVVMAMVLVVAVLLWIVDMILIKSVKWLIG